MQLPQDVGERGIHPSLRSYMAEVEAGNIKARFKGPLLLLDYSEKCTYRSAWNHWTKTARGRIYEWETGSMICCVPQKFFNWGENFDHLPDQLPRLPFVVEEKADGSMCAVWFYNGKWNTSTRGSFDSEQAIIAKRMIDGMNIDRAVTQDTTLIFELIGPSNKIVIPYEQDELVLLTCFNRDGDWEHESDFSDAVARILGVRRPKVYDYTLDDIIGMRDTLPVDDEGWVVRYNNNFRIKVKGTEYLKMAKLISGLSPLAVWEAMEGDGLPERFVMDYPEEFRPELEAIHGRLVKRRHQIRDEIRRDQLLWPEPVTEVLAHRRKQLGLWLKENGDRLKHPGMVFPVLLGDEKGVAKYVRETTRPTSNIIAGE